MEHHYAAKLNLKLYKKERSDMLKNILFYSTINNVNLHEQGINEKNFPNL